MSSPGFKARDENKYCIEVEASMYKLMIIALWSYSFLDDPASVYVQRLPLWEHEFRTSLCWYLDIAQELNFPRKRPRRYRAPSWSWASIDGLVRLRNLSGVEMIAEIIACNVELASPVTPYGAVISGYLTLNGRLREDLWDRKTQKLFRATGENHKDYAPDGLVDALETDLFEYDDGTVPVFCFELGKNCDRPPKEGNLPNTFGLILVSEKGSSSCYKRVGYFQLEMFCSTDIFIDFSFEDCKKQVITII
jgi:hypothetical protein